MADDKREESRLARLSNYFNGELDNNSGKNPITEQEKFDIAVHEASHAIIAYQLNVTFAKTSVKCLNEDGRGITEYCNKVYKSGTKSPGDEKNDREKWAKIALAGPIGEKLYNPESDWENHGHHDFRDAKDQLNISFEFDDIVKEKLRPIKKEVESMIVQYKSLILRVAEELSRVGELSYIDVENIIAEPT